MRLERYVAGVHRYLVSDESSSKSSECTCVLLDEGDGSGHELQQKCSGRKHMAHNRLQLLTECHRHLRHALASLVKSCLHRSILHIKLIRYRCTLSKRLRRFLLLPPHHIEVASKRRYHLGSTSTILAHVLEYWSKYVDVAEFVKTIQQHKKSLVSTLLQRFVELLSIKSRSLYYLVVLLEHIHNDFGNRCCRHLHRLSLAIQHRSEAHYFRNSHLRLCTHASHSLCKVCEIRSRSRAVL